MNNEKGIILIITMMIMSVLLSTAVGFGIFIISDIRQASEIDSSVVAYYSAEAGLERSLFLLRKENDAQIINSTVNLINIESAKNGTMDNNNAIWSIENSYDYESNFFRQRLYGGQSVKLHFLNRDNGNDTESIGIFWYKGRKIDGSTSDAKLQIIFTQLEPQIDGNGVVVYFTDQSPDPLFSDSTLDSPPLKQFFYNFLDEEVEGCISPNCGSPPYDYVVEIRALGLTSDDYIDSLSVIAYDGDNGAGNIVGDGIINITLKSSGEYNLAHQEIVAHIPPRDPVSGLLGFVLFGEEDITKSY